MNEEQNTFRPALAFDDLIAETENNTAGYVKVEMGESYCVRVLTHRTFLQLLELRISRRANKRVINAVKQCVYAVLDMEGGVA